MRRRSPARDDIEVNEQPRRLLSTLLQLPGSAHCSQGRCGSRHGVRCEYADRRSRSCATAWCPDHRIVFDGRVYCRRHAAVVNVLPAPASGDVPPPPDVDNRAPSLTGWMSRELDTPVRDVLAAHAGVAREWIATSPVMLTLLGPDRRRAWERTWLAVSPDGAETRVAVVVEEGDDGRVSICLDGTEQARLAPPWIGRRDVGADDPRRTAFNLELLAALQRALSAGEAASPRGAA